MTDTIINFSTNQSASNLLLSESDVQTLIDASLLAAIPTFDNATNYLAGDKVYYSGIFYIAPVNINLGGGTPLVNTTWRQLPSWGSYTTTATAAGTTTLDVYSAIVQRFSGATTQTVVLPVASTITALGRPFYIINDSTGILTVNSSGGNLVTTIQANQRCKITNILLSGTTAASWTYDLTGIMLTTGTSLTLSSYLNEAKGADIASATTTDIGAATGNYIDVTGTTTITGLGTIQAGTRRIVTFTGALTLTHHATSLILPGGANITTVAGDCAEFVSLGSGNWKCTDYRRITWTGSGSDVKATSPTLIAPVLGVASATSLATSAATPLLLTNGQTVNVALTSQTVGATTLTIPDFASVVDEFTFKTKSQTMANKTLTSPTVNTPSIVTATMTGTTALNGDLQLAENVSILLDAALSADGKWSGICESGVCGETIAFGEICYFKAADSRWWKTDADAEATSGPVKLAVCVVTGTAGDTRTFMLEGKVNAASLYPTLTIGAPVYLSGTSGNITNTYPTSGFVRYIGSGNTADELYFNPSWKYEEVGTITPGFSFGNGTTGITYSLQIGRFTKIGKLVSGNSTTVLTNKGSSTGTARLTGLPYTSGATYYSAAVLEGMNAITFNAQITGYIGPSVSNIVFEETTTGGARTNIDDTDFSNTSSIVINFSYFTD